ncbi:MAG: hypothetical protein M1814_005678 [Vezdaea aestivalis]|nr:MAG: hypothetical protein M1814_005678 [Vezdaea aestivalis]
MNFLLPRKSLPDGSKPSVCIIGAGLAGLRCADVLLRSGFKNVTIFEARDRLGGRIHQKSISGKEFDMGANWIHGSNGNPFSVLAQKTKTATILPIETSRFFGTTGSLIPQDVANRHSEALWTIIGSAYKYCKTETDITSDASLYDYIKSNLSTPTYQSLSSTLVLQMAQEWGCYVGGFVEKQSLKYFWLEECLEGENRFVSSTYHSILSHIARLPLAEATIHLSKPVTKIDFDLASPESIKITTGTDTHRFEECVLTAPLGWLKRNASTTIHPPLPEPLTSAISSVGYSRLEKVYLTFATVFWHDPRSPPPTSTPLFTTWLAPEYAPTTNPTRAIVQAVDLSLLPTPDASPTLLFYLPPPISTSLTTHLATLAPSAHHAYLTSFFAPYYRLLPHYNPSNLPISSLATSWQQDPWAGYGSYTNFEAGGNSNLDADIEALRQGVPQHRLWLAGEHTAPFVGLGTATGAYWAGEKVAERIGRVYGVDVIIDEEE